LKYPDFPVSSKANKGTYSEGYKTYQISGKKNETLFIYSIDAAGPKLKHTNENCKLEIIASEKGCSATIDSKMGNNQLKEANLTGMNIEYVVDGMRERGINVVYDSLQNEYIYESNFQALTDEEKDTGLMTKRLNSVRLKDLGLFDELRIIDLKIVVNSSESAISWASYRLLQRIDHYIAQEEYEHLKNKVIEWIFEHTMEKNAIALEELINEIPSYEELVDAIIHICTHKSSENNKYPIFVEELERVLSKNPTIRWFITAPSILSFQEGGNNT